MLCCWRPRALALDADAAVAALPAVAHVQARLPLYRDLVGTVVLLARDVDALADRPGGLPQAGDG